MYRLTTPEGECLALDCYGIECVCTPDENCDEGCLNQRIARLAQYEDTGLTPEQVTELKERREEKEQADNWISCKESKNIGEGGADTLLFDRGQPVKHGAWCKDEQGYDVYVECSECGLNLSTSNYIENEWRDILKYCPCCGARMDLDNVTHDRCSNYMDCDGSCFIDDTPCDCGGNIEKCKGE